MNEWMNDDDEWEKNVLRFFGFSKKYSLDGKKLPYCEKSAKTFFIAEKNPTSSFKIGGIFGKKMFSNFLETSVIISISDEWWMMNEWEKNGLWFFVFF